MISEPINLGKAPTPELALIVYSDGQATRHPLVTDGQQFAIGAGNLMSSDGFQSMLAPYFEKLSDRADREMREFLPDNVFVRSNTSLGWTVKSRQAPMWFVGGSVTNAPWPNLLFWATKKNGNVSLKVFAVTDEQLSPSSCLFHAPLMNIDSSGFLCFGNVVKPDNISASSIPVFETAIYDSKFSHTNHINTLSGEHYKTGADHVRFWKSLSGAPEFPTERLNPTKWTVADLISGEC
ncbi:hypothetical protein [Endozoicomonas sp. ALC066]|uniref:hypothetical protein n=1 Tax=Endozoicomonas sp. ALC066 TaxID=3403078 RepID=UPI003BB6FE0A